MKNLKYYIIPLLLILSGCEKRIGYNRTIGNISDTLNVTININSMTHKVISNETYTWFYGKLKIENLTNRVISLDATKYIVIINDSIKSSAYFDSYAALYPIVEINPKMFVSHDFYWEFDGKMKLSGINSIKSGYDNSLIP